MIAKRIVDWSISLSVLLIMFPLWIVVATTIKTSSAGPVFFRQRRVGISGSEFTMFKFRSMKVGSDPTSLAGGGDPRVTRIGSWLRSSAFDELPQLINVLRGEMAIVGPRPALPEMVSYYTKIQKERLRVKPGMTGWAQVNGRNSLPYHDRLHLDVWYARNCSLWLDLKILKRTIPALLKREGIYQEVPRPWEQSPTEDTH